MNDFYSTPPTVVEPLLPFLENGMRFFEPCAGDGALIEILTGAGLICVGASDIAPQRPGIAIQDAREVIIGNADVIITNPPWSRSSLRSIIEHLSVQKPTWLLFDADGIHTKQAGPYFRFFEQLSALAVKWIPGSPYTGKDNCARYHFDARSSQCEDQKARYHDVRLRFAQVHCSSEPKPG